MAPRWGWLLLAAVGAVALLGWLLRGVPAGPAPGPDRLPPALAAVPALPASASTGLAAPSAPPASARVGGGEPPLRDLSELAGQIRPGEEPGMAEVIGRLRQSGVREGLAAFNPPGTKALLVGLAVPEGFELPPGYLRHHQATDDGQAVEPILRFAPDFQPVDAQGRTFAVPADRVVPPEWAPPGLPLRRVVIPPPRAASEAAPT